MFIDNEFMHNGKLRKERHRREKISLLTELLILFVDQL